MKPHPSLSTLLTCAILIATPNFAFAQTPNAFDNGGSHGGNGGSQIEIDFKDYGLKFYRFLLTEEGKQVFPEIDAEKFRHALQADLDVVRYSLRDKDNKLKTCVNLDLNGEPLIRINQKSWREDSKKPVTQLRNAVHEYMGVAGIGADEERLNYIYTLRITADVAMKILISSTTANQKVNPLEASEALMAEAEIKREADRKAALEKEIQENANSEAADLAQSRQKEIDLASVRTIKCVDRILKKQLGGKYSPDYAVGSLQKLKEARAQAKQSGSLQPLQQAAEQCEATARGLSREKTDRWIVINYANARQAETKNDLYRLVEGFVKPKVVHCIDRSLSVVAGVGMVGSIGVGGMDCTFTNGRHLFAIGADVGVGMGLGLTAQAARSEFRSGSVVSNYNNLYNVTGIGNTRLILHSYALEPEDDIVLIVDLDTWDAIIESVKNPHRPQGQVQHYPGYMPRKDRHHRRYAIGFGGAMRVIGGLRIPLIPLKKNYEWIYRAL